MRALEPVFMAKRSEIFIGLISDIRMMRTCFFPLHQPTVQIFVEKKNSSYDTKTALFISLSHKFKVTLK